MLYYYKINMSNYLARNKFHNKTNIYVTECLSTNDFLIHLAKKNNLPEWSNVSTGYQFRGRGQRNNEWLSEKNKNLLFSFLFLPEMDIKNQFNIHILVSLGVCYGLKKIGLPNISIKWPNDIYVNDKKISGILIENSISNDKIRKSIIGIGLNVNQKSFKNLEATSIINVMGKKFNLKLIFNIILESIFFKLNSFSASNKLPMEKYKKLLFGLNKNLNFSSDNNFFSGRIVDVRNNGNIVLLVNNEKKYFEYGSLNFL